MIADTAFYEPLQALHLQLDELCSVFVHPPSLAKECASPNAQTSCAAVLLVAACGVADVSDSSLTDSSGGYSSTGAGSEIALPEDSLKTAPPPAETDTQPDVDRGCRSMEVHFCYSRFGQRGDIVDCSSTDVCKAVACTFRQTFTPGHTSFISCLSAACPGEYPARHVQCQIDLALEQADCLQLQMDASACSDQEVSTCLRTPAQRLQFLNDCAGT